jgi:hypothetical protein
MPSQLIVLDLLLVLQVSRGLFSLYSTVAGSDGKVVVWLVIGIIK